MTDSAISIIGLRKTYAPSRRSPAEKEALRSVDLAIPRGMVFGLLGPNGAGKSTLINILAGLVKKSAGTVRINGLDLDADPRATRYQIGVVPQEVVLDPFFSVYEALEYYGGYYGIPKAKRRTKELLAALTLTDKQHVNSRRLSGGMKRRVLIAKALVHSPPIVILDEPTAGVDVELRSQLWDYVRVLNKQGTTVMLTTHYLEEAESLCDRVAIINHGTIIANDTVKGLKKLLDYKKLILRFSDAVKEVPKTLEAFKVEQPDAHTLTITYQPSKTSIEELLHFTKQANLAINDLSTEEPDLEDVFRKMVAG